MFPNPFTSHLTSASSIIRGSYYHYKPACSSHVSWFSKFISILPLLVRIFSGPVSCLQRILSHVFPVFLWFPLYMILSFFFDVHDHCTLNQSNFFFFLWNVLQFMFIWYFMIKLKWRMFGRTSRHIVGNLSLELALLTLLILCVESWACQLSPLQS